MTTAKPKRWWSLIVASVLAVAIALQPATSFARHKFQVEIAFNNVMERVFSQGNLQSPKRHDVDKLSFLFLAQLTGREIILPRKEVVPDVPLSRFIKKVPKGHIGVAVTVAYTVVNCIQTSSNLATFAECVQDEIFEAIFVGLLSEIIFSLGLAHILATILIGVLAFLALYLIIDFVRNWSRDRKNEPRSLSQPAVSWGEPHITTIDQLDYDFQAVGEFVLIKSKVGGLQIQVRQEPWRNSRDLSHNTAVAFDLHGSRVSVYAGENPEFYIDNQPVRASQFVKMLAGISVLERQGDEYKIRWLDGSWLDIRVYPGSHLDVELALSESHRGMTGGLLGNFDGTAANDLTSRDGSVLNTQNTHSRDLYDIFGESWRISNLDSLFTYEDGMGTEDFTDNSFPGRILSLSKLDPANVWQAREACLTAGIPEGPVLRGCTFDYAATGDDVYIEGALALSDPVASTEGERDTLAREIESQNSSVSLQSCEQYAERAVQQNQRNNDLNCGFAGRRWQSEKQNHLSWCLGVGFNSASVIEEDAARRNRLAACETASENRPIRSSTLERFHDRLGNDYRSFLLGSPDFELCRDACLSESQCMAWTYVRPGVQDPRLARCWLKHSVPPATSNGCCTSGKID